MLALQIYVEERVETSKNVESISDCHSKTTTKKRKLNISDTDRLSCFNIQVVELKLTDTFDAERLLHFKIHMY